MGVYVDRSRIPYVNAPHWQQRRYRMSHLMADTTDELWEIADRLGLSRYVQNLGTPTEHLDVTDSKRRAAIAMGAQPVTGRDLVAIIRAKRRRTANEPRA